MLFHLTTDQPTTCPICGARTDIIGDFWHTKMQYFVSECMDYRCKHVILEAED